MNGCRNETKASQGNTQETNSSDNNNTTDTSKRYRFEYLIKLKKNFFYI
jgi:hypothetical protein